MARLTPARCSVTNHTLDWIYSSTNSSTPTEKSPPIHQDKETLSGIIHTIVGAPNYTTDPKCKHTSELVQLGFYFCL